jgi:lipoate-protein ligase A
MAIRSIFIDDSFDTAAENMHFDEQLLERLEQEPDKRFFRFYEWKNPGITLSYNKDIPASLLEIDHSKRLSGGGVVFHSPGDIVFSITARLDDDFFPKKFKDKLCFVSNTLSNAITDALEEPVTSTAETTEKNILFCNSYPNPYERYVNGEKVLALAQRKYRDLFLIQGVIHCSSNFEYFSQYTDYTTYFTQGAKSQITFAHFNFQDTFST